MHWEPGDVIVERQVWRGQVVFAVPTVVVEANEWRFVTYTPPGAPYWFPEEPSYPGPGGRHPWYGRTSWVGHGKLTVTAEWMSHSVIHLWEGPERAFSCWYLNIEEPMRRTPIGFDTQDLELDIVLHTDGTWFLKDDELLDQRVAEGRWTAEQAAAIRASAAGVVREVVEPGAWWWEDSWPEWTPPELAAPPAFPDGWLDVPPTSP